VCCSSVAGSWWRSCNRSSSRAVRDPRAAALPEGKEMFQSLFQAGNPAASQLHLQQTSDHVFQRKGRRGEPVLEDTEKNPELSLYTRIKVGTWTDFFVRNSVKELPHLSIIRHTMCTQGPRRFLSRHQGCERAGAQEQRQRCQFRRWETKSLRLTRGAGESVAGLVTDPQPPRYQSSTTVITLSSPCC